MEPNSRTYVLFHKPRGVLTAKQRCATNPALPTVIEVLVAGGLATAAELSPVGRLDAESEGLLLLTDDGWLNHCMTHPSFVCRKTYLAVARGRGRLGRRQRVRAGWCARLVQDGVLLRPSGAPPYTAKPASMCKLSFDDANAALGGGLARCLDELANGEEDGDDGGDGGGDGDGDDVRGEGDAYDGDGDGTGDAPEGAAAAAAAAAAADLDFVSVTMTEGKKHEARPPATHSQTLRSATPPVSPQRGNAPDPLTAAP